jgi:phosphoglycolate phosphatase-like HAD superfamily hydrolase
MVNDRISSFRRGELDIDDLTIKGAIVFLKLLHSKGLKLYLASGTDSADVINEAKVLGYADLFNGRIYGWSGETTESSKKAVIEKIMSENKLSGAQLLVVGDGPVELRESRKRQGLALGVASDEVRRYGLNPEKRARLVKAGAHVIIPDFSQTDKIAQLLFSVL